MSDTDSDGTVVATAPVVDVQKLTELIVADLAAGAVPGAIGLLVTARDEARQYGYGATEYHYELPEGQIGGPAHTVLDLIMPDDQESVPGSVHAQIEDTLGAKLVHTKGGGGWCEVVVKVFTAAAAEAEEAETVDVTEPALV